MLDNRTPPAKPSAWRRFCLVAFGVASSVLLLLGASCAAMHAPPTAAVMAAADYGRAPTDWQARTRRFVLVEYRKHRVYEVTVADPATAWFGKLGGVLVARDVRYGWAVRFSGHLFGFWGLYSVIDGEVFFRNNRLEGVSDRHYGFRLVPNDARW